MSRKVHPFLATMRHLGRGTLLDQLTELHHEMVSMVRDRQAAGAITIKLKYVPGGDEDRIDIESDISQSLPKVTSKSMFFVDADGNTVRNDPRQPDMLAAVPGGEAVKFDPDTGEVVAS